MELNEALEKRRSYRALKEFELTEDIISGLAEAASLAPSCYNNQPWRFVFIYEKDKLKEFHTALSGGNSWAQNCPLLIAVFAKTEDDCVSGEREYYLFDTGLAVENLLLKAVDLGLVAHAMAGYDEDRAREILNISEENRLITVIGVGQQATDTKKAQQEQKRPERLPREEFVFHNELKDKED